MYKRVIFLVLLSLTLAHIAYALPTTVTFTANNFTNHMGNPAPTDPVTGSITYDTLGDWSTGNPVLSVNLDINGYNYTASNVNAGINGSDILIGGTLSGITGISWATDDFWLIYTNNTPDSFFYSVSGTADVWSSNVFSQFSVQEGAAPVPEPGTMMLLGAGFLGLAVLGKRRKNV
ncbi:MAG TPA: hypothetical protein DDY22_17165 [Geobacter sp.]|nr:hypothetical protein [Geobacter sp.]